MTVEVGYSLARGHVNSHPTVVLVHGWETRKPATFDVTVASPLTPVTLNSTSTSVRAAPYAAECRKHATNDTRCQELGWACISLAVEMYGNWGIDAQSVFFPVLPLYLPLARPPPPNPKMLAEIYGFLNMSLVRSVLLGHHGNRNFRIGW